MKVTRVAINGFGRIGRNILRAYFEGHHSDNLEIVAINDLGDAAINAHLLQYDSVHGRFTYEVSHDTHSLTVDGRSISVFAERDPSRLPWQSLDIDVVLECTGLFTQREKAAAHIKAGAKKVLISAPSPDADATIVFGVNDHILHPEHQVVSNASCTTNCLAPVVQVLHELMTIESGIMTTIHAYTNDQHLTDVYHTDPYRARSATASMIPTKTGAAAAIGLVIPEMAGKFDGLAVRVPTNNVSLVDLSIQVKQPLTAEAINKALEKAAHQSKVLGYNGLPLVSIDFNHCPDSSVFDGSHTRVQGNLVKVMAWYDNEWGFSNRMLDTTQALMAAKSS
ncbi:type I glyceraldehyde-3-phosphate dehydrogenase [Oceanospirillum linum]|uniref:Glyceraldehyde-3-phosphate dehydrogenase n=1 Tax=Oceanospirillum linum TaxID=966 RepID=A0A1T1HE03_OCELI|nr:type I glyceraldehyde-3-phosphate dehydrogenase [Oceanospirillum linum]OOV88084.1 type I glyceraldehyde-3-phosphate dehydrogenase [Oceanospirillum linum]SEF42599.1 glyceraldehyde-3-phosphate dehydrogenase (NAD+) [Oleiphilus messinensis]SMP01091.1 glyceraldehyde-3-phosphate dehydrogenase (NAD+) [Oceanospirillum linum]